MAQYIIYNGAAPTTAVLTGVTTGTNIKTMLQVLPSATNTMKVKKWGISFNGTAANTPIAVELIETDVAATVTAHVQAGIVPYDAAAIANGNVTTNLIQVGTSHTGYTATNEGTIGSSRLFDSLYLTPANGIYVHEFSLGLEPTIQISKYLRIRVHAGTAVDCKCWVLVEL